MRRFTVDEYHRLIEIGLLTEDDPVELLDGWIVWKMPHNPPHDTALELTDEQIRPHLPADRRLRIQCPVTIGESEPEPDVAVVRGQPRDRQGRHPGPHDLDLLVEVADTTLTRDRNDKGRFYAAGSIMAYWIVNLVDRQIEVYSDPTGPGPNARYRQRQDYRPGDEVPLVIDGKEIARLPVAEFFP